MMEKNKYSFPSGKFYLDFRTAIITGVCRSGKTTLGNLLSSYLNVEHSEEPWILDLLPAMTKLKMIGEKTGKDMFVAYLHELMNNTILLRQANFRPQDTSSIWIRKPAAEIFSRLVNLQTRADVKAFVEKNKPVFLLIIPESPLFNLPAIFDFVPDCKIINIIRRGTDVAHQFKGKGWLSNDQLTKPPHARIYYQTTHKGRPFYIPCWIDPKDAKKFIGYSEYERGLLYWCALMEKMINSLKKSKNKKRCLTVKFEELMENPRKTMEKAASFLNLKSSSMTETVLREIRNYKNVREEVLPLPKELVERAKKIYEYLGYGWD